MIRRTSRLWARIPEAALCGAMLAMLAGPLAVKLASCVTTVPQLLPDWGGLVGVARHPRRPAWTADGWLAREFQGSFDSWFSQTFPGREALVRFNNQIDYSLFSKSYMSRENIIIADGRQLYQTTYLEDYCNIQPLVPASRLETLAERLALLQRKLRQRGIASAMLISPSKAAIVPEHIPEVYLAHRTGAPRDYDRLIPLLEKHKVCFVDGHRISAEARDAGTLVFPAGGTHWSMPAACLTTNALMDALRNQAPHPDLPRLRLGQIVPSATPVGSDGDLAQLLNLLVPPLDYPTFQARVSRTPDAAKCPPSGRLVIVGCSFSQQAIRTLCTANIFEQIDYYFYYKKHRTIPGGTAMTKVDASTIDWDRDVFGAKAIVLEANEALLNRPYYGEFIEDALRALERSDRPYDRITPPSPLATRTGEDRAARN